MDGVGRCSFVISKVLEIAFMRDDIRPAKITTKPRSRNPNFNLYDELIPKAVMMKRTRP